ncbi:hypothetical protein P692DRAFT_20841724, partial [Suillus brevipes Sb2]
MSSPSPSPTTTSHARPFRSNPRLLRPSRSTRTRGRVPGVPPPPPLDREVGTANQTANLPRPTVSFSQE